MPKSTKYIKYFLLLFFIVGAFVLCFNLNKKQNISFSKTTDVISNYLNPVKIDRAYAQINPNEKVSKLINVLTQTPEVGTNQWPWVIEIWKWSLALANLILVLILLGIGIINIMHIQYDTYQIKKALPLLIIGVVLANLSLFIMRMLLYAANILTDSFMQGGSAGAMAKELITAVSMSSKGNVFLSAWSSVGGLLIAVIFGLFAAIGFIILGFMFYMRYAAIVMLAIAAPLAFVLMAFPPTQGLFKQWWSWATRFIFMKPLALFFLFVAWQIQKAGGSGDSITAWIIKTALVYFAILVPWKLGGVVASMWGSAGKWASTPVRDWAKRRGRQAALMAKRLPGIRQAIQGGMADEMNISNQEKEFEEQNKHSARLKGGGRVARQEEEMKRNQLERDTENEKIMRDIDVEMNGRMIFLKAELAREKELSKMDEDTMINNMEEGTIAPDAYMQRRMQRLNGNLITDRTREIMNTNMRDLGSLRQQAPGVTTADALKDRYVSAHFEAANAADILNKRRMIDLTGRSNDAEENHNNLMANLQGLEVVDGQSYDASQTKLSALRNQLDQERDPVKKEELRREVARYEQGIRSFEASHSGFEFRDYLNKNKRGRMASRINRALGEEVDAITKSETIDQMLNSAENGGGTSEFVFTADEFRKVLSGRGDEVSGNAKYGIQSYLMAIQHKVATGSPQDRQMAEAKMQDTFDRITASSGRDVIAGVVSQQNFSAQDVAEINAELVQHVGAGVTLDTVTAAQIDKLKITDPSSKLGTLASKIKPNIQSALHGTSQQIRNKVKSTMGPALIEQVNKELAESFGPGVNIDNVTGEQLQQVDITKQNSRLRDFINRMAVGYHDHLAFGTAGSPFTYSGRGANKNIANVVRTANVDEISAQIPGGAERALDIITERDATGTSVLSQIESETTDVLARVLPTGTDLSTLTDTQREQVLEAIGDRKTYADTTVLNARIAEITGIGGAGISASGRNLEDLRVQSKRLSTGKKNIKDLARRATADRALPYMNQYTRNMTLDQAQETRENVIIMTQQTARAIRDNQKLSEIGGLREGVDEVLRAFGHTREQREQILDNMDENQGIILNILDDAGTAIESSVELKREKLERMTQINEERAERGQEPAFWPDGTPVYTHQGAVVPQGQPIPRGSLPIVDPIILSPEHNHRKVEAKVREVVDRRVGLPRRTPTTTPPPTTTPTPTTPPSAPTPPPPTTTTPPTNTTPPRPTPAEIQQVRDNINAGLYTVQDGRVIDLSGQEIDFDASLLDEPEAPTPGQE